MAEFRLDVAERIVAPQALATTKVAMSNNLSSIKPMLRKPPVLIAAGFSNSTLYLQIKTGLFIPAVKLSARAVGWPEHEVQAVIAARVAGKTENDIKSLVSSLVAARKTAS